MNLDTFLYRLPLVGAVIRRIYGYFRNHIAITDAMHVALGFGLGIFFARNEMSTVGIIAIIAAIFGHIFALIKGK